MNNNIKLLLLFIFVSSLTIGCYIYPSKKYNIRVEETACIQPYSKYTYKTCSNLNVKINDEYFLIPAGFETDLASIPRFYWSILAPQYSAFVTPSIVHDYFYRCINHKSRKYADDVFYYALLNEGVSKYTAIKFYMGVRYFGSHSYIKNIKCNE